MRLAVTRADVAALAVAVLGAVGVAANRATAVAVREAAQETSETYALPPPDQLVVLSMGYRAAIADYLWAHVLVTQGLRLKERRRFETIVSYLDAITTLDPSFIEPYRLADALTTVQVKAASVEEIRAVRRLLEQGVEHHPNDAELWLTLGSFVTYVAPTSYLQKVDAEEAQRWRREGADYLARAAELGSHDATIAWQAIGGVRQMHRAGELQASVRFLRRAMAVTEDAELRAHLSKQLGALLGEEEAHKAAARRSRFEEMWRASYPTLSITAVHAAAPPFDPAACAGGTLALLATEPTCATSWPAWYERVDAELTELELFRARAGGDGGNAP